MRYNENSRLGDITSENYQLLLLLSRFGIPLGFGDKTVRAVCTDAGVDTKTFLAVTNYVATGDGTAFHDINVSAMIKFLRFAHQYYCELLLPELRQSLQKLTIDIEDKKMAGLVIRLFDSYASSVRKHLDYEDTTLFEYTECLVEGRKPRTGLTISALHHQHDSIDGSLNELKNVMIKYFPTQGMERRVNQILYHIFACEEDLKSHCDIEDNLFIPAVVDLEHSLSDKEDNGKE